MRNTLFSDPSSVTISDHDIPGTPYLIYWIDDQGEKHTFVKKIAKRSKWHKVEDELPSDVRLVLAYSESREPYPAYYYLATYSSKSGWVSCFNNKPLEYITHWRELPKPPKD